MSACPSTVCVPESGLRDGLQPIAAILPTEHMQAWICRAWRAGLPDFNPARAAAAAHQA
jgi:hypothetical protein